MKRLLMVHVPESWYDGMLNWLREEVKQNEYQSNKSTEILSGADSPKEAPHSPNNNERVYLLFDFYGDVYVCLKNQMVWICQGDDTVALIFPSFSER